MTIQIQLVCLFDELKLGVTPNVHLKLLSAADGDREETRTVRRTVYPQPVVRLPFLGLYSRPAVHADGMFVCCVCVCVLLACVTRGLGIRVQ
jgi:hypothetical protein